MKRSSFAWASLAVTLALSLACGLRGTPMPSPSPMAVLPGPLTGPALSVDRVGLPQGYRDSFRLFYLFDRPGNKQARVVYANDKAASRRSGEPYPYGSILVIEHYAARVDEHGNIRKDASGRYVRGDLINVFVMRKEPGFGVDYQHLRSGEWEYAAYSPDGTHFLPPERTFACAACHQAAGQGKDWVFRGDIFFTADRYGTPPLLGPNEIGLDSISFYPSTVTVAVGVTLGWVNNDTVPHTVIAREGAFGSPPLKPGEGFSYTFATAGVFEYFCSIHPEQMKAKIEVRR